jgi:hypothetical protein
MVHRRGRGVIVSYGPRRARLEKRSDGRWPCRPGDIHGRRGEGGGQKHMRGRPKRSGIDGQTVSVGIPSSLPTISEGSACVAPTSKSTGPLPPPIHGGSGQRSTVEQHAGGTKTAGTNQRKERDWRSFRSARYQWGRLVI